MGYEPHCSKRAVQEAGMKSRGAKTCKCLAARAKGRQDARRRSGMVLFDWSLDENDLNMFSGYGGEDVEDSKGIRECWTEMMVRAWAIGTQDFRVGSFLGHPKAQNVCLAKMHNLTPSWTIPLFLG